MDKMTLTALKDSIKHWQSNVRRKPENAKMGASNCALCSLFNTARRKPENICRGCPVMKATGLRHCGGTPYSGAVDARRFAGAGQWRVAAQAELDFLRSLLPALSGTGPA